MMKHQNSGKPALKFRATLNFLMTLSVSWSGNTFGDEPIDVEAIARNLDDFGQRLSTLRSNIDKSNFVPDDQVDKLDFEPETIIEFVSEEIVFHPYEGALRGAAGTLQTRAGNSLDQAILLAYLLNTAGYDASIVQAQLSEVDALRLLRTVETGRVPQSLDYMEQVIEDFATTSSNESSATSGGPAETEDAHVEQDVLEIEEELNQLLASAGIVMESENVTNKLLPKVQSYFWVQHRGDSTLEWQDAHPAFGKNVTPSGLEPERRFEESIPAEFHHQFTISAWIEQWQAGSIKKHRVMKPWSSPVANLIGKSLRYHNAPSGLNQQNVGDFEAALEKTTVFTPMFNGAIAPGAQAFDLKGRTVDMLAMGGSGAGGIFQTIGDKFESATTGIADRKDGKPTFALHSMYLEFTFTAPSGQTETSKRFLLAPRERYDDDSTVIWALITDHNYMVAPGNHPVELLVDRLLAANIQGLDWLEFMVRESFEPDKENQIPEEMPTGVQPLLQHWLMDQVSIGDPTVIKYRTIPALLGIRQGYRDAQTAFSAVDIVFNRVEHVRKTDSGIESAPKSSLKAGVWDTVLESIPASSRTGDLQSVISTAWVFELAKQQGIESVVLRPGESDRVKQLGIDSNAARFVGEALEDGFAVVIPSRLPEGAPMAGWWRVDPQSGETLGMTGDGYGQDMMVYVNALLSHSTRFMNAQAAIQRCEEKGSMAEKLCCLVNAHANNVMGVAFGGWMKNSFSKSVMDVYKIANGARKISNAVAGTGKKGAQPDVEAMSCSDIPTGW
jgi:hypothetical protein